MATAAKVIITDLGDVRPLTLYSLNQVAAALGVSWDAVDKAVRDGKLPHRVVGHHKKVFGADLLGYVGLSGPLPKGKTAAEVEAEVAATLEKAKAMSRGAGRRRAMADEPAATPKMPGDKRVRRPGGEPLVAGG